MLWLGRSCAICTMAYVCALMLLLLLLLLLLGLGLHLLWAAALGSTTLQIVTRPSGAVNPPAHSFPRIPALAPPPAATITPAPACAPAPAPTPALPPAPAPALVPAPAPAALAPPISAPPPPAPAFAPAALPAPPAPPFPAPTLLIRFFIFPHPPLLVPSQLSAPAPSHFPEPLVPPRSNTSYLAFPTPHLTASFWLPPAEFSPSLSRFPNPVNCNLLPPFPTPAAPPFPSALSGPAAVPSLPCSLEGAIFAPIAATWHK